MERGWKYFPAGTGGDGNETDGMVGYGCNFCPRAHLYPLAPLAGGVQTLMTISVDAVGRCKPRNIICGG